MERAQLVRNITFGDDLKERDFKFLFWKSRLPGCGGGGEPLTLEGASGFSSQGQLRLLPRARGGLWVPWCDPWEGVTLLPGSWPPAGQVGESSSQTITTACCRQGFLGSLTAGPG